MATNQNVERLAVRKGGVIDLVIEDLPQIPQSLQRRFPELMAWQSDLNGWKDRLQAILKDQLGKLRDSSS